MNSFTKSLMEVLPYIVICAHLATVIILARILYILAEFRDERYRERVMEENRKKLGGRK